MLDGLSFGSPSSRPTPISCPTPSVLVVTTSAYVFSQTSLCDEEKIYPLGPVGDLHGARTVG